MCPFINRSPSCLRSKAVTKAWDMFSCHRHNGHYYYYHDLTWMRCHRGHKPHWPRTLFDSSIPPWILLDFNIDPWPHSPPWNQYLPKAVQGYAYQKHFFTTHWMTVWDCFFSALYSPFLEQHFLVSVSIFFVTKISLFHLQNTYLNSEEFCLFEYYEDGQDISCRSMMFGASRLLWEANFFCCHFCRDRKEDSERLELLLVRSSFMFFFLPAQGRAYACLPRNSRG